MKKGSRLKEEVKSLVEEKEHALSEVNENDLHSLHELSVFLLLK